MPAFELFAAMDAFVNADVLDGQLHFGALIFGAAGAVYAG